ncbi:TonB-dependent receptor [uncultured Draconibacterium sp.]|uniref:SusC/RagA family TonB-linked outer membrane protein n=1 Tax=uncultured Draconibacterium sp. TaxID=1573823 RepID=UPI0025EFA491|nr:TonB-dependent receptor [uncultured Draconibacterium sp.]
MTNLKSERTKAMRIKRLCAKMLALVMFVFTASVGFAQEVSVNGNVTDAKTGEPIPGVTVVVKGTGTGTVTNIDGNYSLSGVASDATLQFSFVGLKAQEILVAGKSVINVKMEADAIGLAEVVAIGYGTAKRADITGAVSSVSTEQLTAAPVGDVTQALKGKLAGVNVTTQDGRPGADVSIRVRGGGSISQSNDPLFIVDGFPVSSISNIPASQIESIDVLKDASSTAIYGSRGANGVIMVTTKGGKAGKIKVTYDAYSQWSTIPEYLDVMGSYDYILYNWAYGAAIGDQYADAWEKMWSIGRYEGSNSAGIDHYRNVPSKNYTEELFNNGFTHNHNFNIGGGTQTTKYLLAVNYLDQEGTKVGSGYERANVSFKMDQDLGDKLKFTINTRFAEVTEDEKANEGNSTAYYFRPIATEDVLGDMDVTSNTQLGDYNDILQDEFNPISQLNDGFSERVSRSLVVNTSLSWEIVNGLTAKTDLGYSMNWYRQKTWSGAINNNYLTTDGTPTYSGNATVRAGEGWNLRWVNTLNYEVQGLGDNHKLNVLGGMEISDSGSEWTQQWGQRYPVSYDAERAFANMDQFLVLPLTGTSLPPVYGGLDSNIGTPYRMNSYFGRANYTFKDKYLLTGTFRADGSSRFAPSNRWGYFPAAAFGWRMSEEAFLQDVSWLDNLKMRLSYGSVGNDGIGADLWKQSWKPGTTRWSINETPQSNYTPASNLIANPDLKWETTITRNLGFDFAMFNSRLSGSLELYKNTVKDLLLVSPVSDLTGFQYTQKNIGQTSNKGLELSLRGDIIRGADFNLRGSININVNRNNIDELAEGINGQYSSGFGGVHASPGSGDYYLEEGKAVGRIRGWIWDGMYTIDDFNYDSADGGVYTLKDGVPDMASGMLSTIYGTMNHKPGAQTAYPGVQKFRDISGPDGIPDGVVDDYDITVIGDTNPAHTGGFSLNGNYKNIDFGLDFNWSYGNDIYNATHQNAYLGIKEAGLYRNRYQELAGHYKIYDVVNGQITPVVEPAALSALNANSTTFIPYAESASISTFCIEDGSFLRLNTITLGYTIPSSVLDKVGIERFRIYGSIYNALTWTSYSGFDPEVSVDESSSDYYPTPGLDYRAYPRDRSFTLGVNIEF